jgi:glycolate oxidase iron-sulfur subunit
MKTNLAQFIKDTPEGQEANSILRACVHCGFCTATCPTYQLLGDELDGPRGRIYLMKEVLEGREVSAKTQLHLDRCLTCRACETTCPSGVKYGRLVDIGRNIVEKRVGRSATEALKRKALRAILPNPALFNPLLKLGQLTRPLLPEGIRRKVPAPVKAGNWPAPRHARRMLVLQGCVQPGIAPGINPALARVLDRIGISLIASEQAGCCGAVSYHLNAQEEGLDYMRRNIDAWWPHVEQGVEAIVMTASGCGVLVKEYGHLLAHDPKYADKAKRISALTRDASEVLSAEREALAPRLTPPASRLLHPAARSADPGPGGVAAHSRGLCSDRRAGCAPLLRIGRHLLDPAIRTLAATADEQGRGAAVRAAERDRDRQHRLPRAHPGRHHATRAPLGRAARSGDVLNLWPAARSPWRVPLCCLLRVWAPSRPGAHRRRHRCSPIPSGCPSPRTSRR